MAADRATPAGHAAGTGSVLANRDFVKLWAGETVSLVGTQITQLALPLVAILTLNATVLQVGVLNAMRYAPAVVFSLLAGVWLDRCRRRPVLVASDLALAVLIGLIPLASVLGMLSIWLLFVIAALVGVAQVFFDIGSLSYLPGLVQREHLAAANGKMQVSYSVAGIAGPSLAGLLIGLLTAPVTLVVDAVSCLVSMMMLLSIRRTEPRPPAADDRTSVAASIAEGLRAVFGSRLLRSLLVQSCTFNFIYNALFTVFMVYAVRQLGLDATALGVVLGAGSVAAFAAAVFAGRITAALGPGRTLLIATLGCCLAPLLLLVPTDGSPAALMILGVAQAVSGATAVVFNITTVTLRQIVTPDRLLARMNGSYRMLLFGTGPLGAVTGGALGSALGLRAALVVTAIAMITPTAWILFSPVFRLTEMPSRPPAELDRPDAPADQPGALANQPGAPADQLRAPADQRGAASDRRNPTPPPAERFSWWGQPTVELRRVEPATFDWWSPPPRRATRARSGPAPDFARDRQYPHQRAS